MKNVNKNAHKPYGIRISERRPILDYIRIS